MGVEMALGRTVELMSDSVPPRRVSRRERVEVADGVELDCLVVGTRFGEHVRMPHLTEVMPLTGVAWWGYAPISAANLLGLSTQVPRAYFLLADRDPGLHRRLRAEVRVRDVARWGGLTWPTVTLLALLGTLENHSEYSTGRALRLLADRLGGHVDAAVLERAAAAEPPKVTELTFQFLDVLAG